VAAAAVRINDARFADSNPPPPPAVVASGTAGALVHTGIVVRDWAPAAPPATAILRGYAVQQDASHISACSAVGLRCSVALVCGVQQQLVLCPAWLPGVRVPGYSQQCRTSRMRLCSSGRSDVHKSSCWSCIATWVSRWASKAHSWVNTSMAGVWLRVVWRTSCMQMGGGLVGTQLSVDNAAAEGSCRSSCPRALQAVESTKR
jgi:hypothetical protein